jgi:cytoskeletal protein RodZ
VTPLPKLLLAAALLLGAVGLVVALVQPGGLGDDDGGTETAQPERSETETETETDVEAGTENDTTSTTASDGTTSTSTTASSGAAPTTTVAAGADGTAPTTTTTRPSGSGGSIGGSGLDGDRNVPRDLEDGLAATGGTSAIGTAVLIGLAGLALRRRTT